MRGAVGLGLAVFVANRTGVQHSFWVVLGTLSVLRSNALNTGQFIARGVLGTAIGFAIGAAVVAAIGTDTALLWVLLPFAVLLAGVAPAVISFAAGQAAFTLTLLILFNIIQPAGWRIGLVRIEDVALGCAVSLVVGLLFWPRGAGGGAAPGPGRGVCRDCALPGQGDRVRRALLRLQPADPSGAEPGGRRRRSAASRRLDDAFRSYLAERGAKPVPLAGVTSLVTGVAALRLTADAVLDLWQRDQHQAEGDRTAASAELVQRSVRVNGWYDELAASLSDLHQVPVPLRATRLPTIASSRPCATTCSGETATPRQPRCA